jgi:hypothetical protein
MSTVVHGMGLVIGRRMACYRVSPSMLPCSSMSGNAAPLVATCHSALTAPGDAMRGDVARHQDRFSSQPQA